MQYQPPIGGDNSTPYQDENPAQAIEGTFVPDDFFNAVSAELVVWDLAGAVNAYTVTTAPAELVPAYTDRLVLRLKVGAGLTNTGAATLDPNGVAAKAIKRPDGTALQAGDVKAGAVIIVAYDSSADYWVLVNWVRSGLPVELATITGVSSGFGSTSFADIDCSSAFPAGVDVDRVGLRVKNNSGSTVTAFAAKRKGHGDAVGQVYRVVPDGAYTDLEVGVDTNGKIEAYVSGNTVDVAVVYVIPA